jgi:uncharacterized protein
MTLSQLQRMFHHIAEFYEDHPRRMDFVWHGGEPLLIEPSYYESIVGLQQTAFDPVDIRFTNSVQTNLTILNPEVLAFLKSGIVSNVGVSIDLFGDQRVNVAGRSSQSTVLRNMQRLIDEGISFGCITVLSRVTHPHVEAIYRFFEEIDTSFRLLPIYRTGYPGQQDELALSDQEIVNAFKKVVDLWLTSDNTIQVRPIQDYIANVVGKLTNAERRSYYNKLVDEVVYIVEPDGSLYSVADPPDASLCHGNIFEQTLFELKRADGYLRSVSGAEARMADACSSCQYHGICSGYFVGEATPEQRSRDEEGRVRCGVAKPVQEYIEQVLTSAGVFREVDLEAAGSVPDWI